MHHANQWYGHAHVLARYCGLTGEPPRIEGYLQHGWNVLDGFGVVIEPEPGFVRFVWSEVCRRRGQTMGKGEYYVVGAPWGYLLEMEPEPAETEREGTIWYPFHGWEQQKVTGDHDRLVAQIREAETGPVTVCLYWMEYADPEVRRAYEDAGFRVITHGYRGKRYRRGNPGFLARQLAEQRRHRRVASNRLSTAVFYGAAAGCDVAVYGDPMALENHDPVMGGLGRIHRNWPELHGVETDRAAAREIARAELGLDRLLTPPELRELFGWSREP